MSSGPETRGAGQGFGPRPRGSPRPTPRPVCQLRAAPRSRSAPSRECLQVSAPTARPRLFLCPPRNLATPRPPVSLRPARSATPRRQKAPENVSLSASFGKSLESLLRCLPIAPLKTSADTFSSSQALIFQVWESLTVYFIPLHGQIDCYFTVNFSFPTYCDAIQSVWLQSTLSDFSRSAWKIFIYFC